MALNILKDMGDPKKLKCNKNQCDLSEYAAYQHVFNIMERKLKEVGR